MKLSPSAANNWVACPGMVRLQDKFPAINPDTTKREEGRAAHWCAERMILCSLDDPQNAVAPNGLTITEEMKDAASVYVDAITRMSENYKKWGVEKVVHIPLLSGEKGVVDFFDFDEELGLLTIWDFKYGHTAVEAVRNYQLFLYATVLKSEFSPKSTRFIIVQPRAIHPEGPVRIWTLTDEDYADMEAVIIARASEAYSEIPPTRTGQQCHNCSASHACGTLQKAPVKDWADAVGSSETNLTSPQGLATTHQLLENAGVVLKALKSGVQGRMEFLLSTGVSIPGFALTPIPGRLKWSHPAAEVEAFAESLGVKVLKPSELITPTQAKKAGMPEKTVDALSSRASSLKLMKENPEMVKALFGVPEIAKSKGDKK